MRHPFKTRFPFWVLLIFERVCSNTAARPIGQKCRIGAGMHFQTKKTKSECF